MLAGISSDYYLRLEAGPRPQPLRPGAGSPRPGARPGLRHHQLPRRPDPGGDVEAPNGDPVADHFGALAELREAGLIRHLGLSTVSSAQLAEAQAIAPVVTVQNLYNLASRQDDALVEHTAAENIAFVPYFPLGGFSPLQSETLTKVAERLGASAQQVALAWLLQRSPNIALIPGTSSPEHLRENIAAASLVLPEDAITELDGIGQPTAG